MRDCLSGISLQPVVDGLDWSECGVLRELGEYRRQGAYTDVAFLCGDDMERVDAHRAALECRSPFLSGLIRSAFCESCCNVAEEDSVIKVMVPDVGKTALEKLLELLYTGK